MIASPSLGSQMNLKISECEEIRAGLKQAMLERGMSAYEIRTVIEAGSDEVPELAREAASDRPGKKRLPGERPLSESRIERNGLKAGTPAPPFRLPDLYGREAQ